MCSSDRSSMILMSRIPLTLDVSSSEYLLSDVASCDCSPSLRITCSWSCDSSKARWCSHSEYLLCSDLRSLRNSLMMSSLFASAESSSVSSRLMFNDIVLFIIWFWFALSSISIWSAHVWSLAYPTARASCFAFISAFSSSNLSWLIWAFASVPTCTMIAFACPICSLNSDLNCEYRNSRWDAASLDIVRYLSNSSIL